MAERDGAVGEKGLMWLLKSCLDHILYAILLNRKLPKETCLAAAREFELQIQELFSLSNNILISYPAFSDELGSVFPHDTDFKVEKTDGFVLLKGECYLVITKFTDLSTGQTCNLKQWVRLAWLINHSFYWDGISQLVEKFEGGKYNSHMSNAIAGSAQTQKKALQIEEEVVPKYEPTPEHV